MQKTSFWQRLCFVWRVANLRRLFLVQLLSNTAFANSIVVLFMEARGLDYMEMFLLESIISLVILVLELPSGVWADRWGRRRIIVTAMWLLTASSIIFALARSFWVFALEAALFGVGMAFLSGSDQALVYESLAEDDHEERAAEVFGILGMAPSLGVFVGMTTGSFFAVYGLEVPVYLTAIATTMAALLSLGLKEPARQTAELGSGDVQGTLAGAARAWRDLRDRPLLLSYGLFTAVVWLPGLAVYYLNQPLFRSVGMPVIWFGPVMGAARLMTAAGSAAAPGIGRRFGINNALLVAVVTQGGLLAIAPFSRTPLAAGLLIGLILGLGSIRVPLVQAESNRLIGGANRAAILSSMGLLSSIVAIVIKPLIGTFTNLSLTTGFWFLAFLSFGCAGIFFWVWRGRTSLQEKPDCM